MSNEFLILLDVHTNFKIKKNDNKKASSNNY